MEEEDSVMEENCVLIHLTEDHLAEQYLLDEVPNSAV
jgi:hypothetical protein